MPKAKRQAEAPVRSTQEPTAALIRVLSSLKEQVGTLVDQIGVLTERAHVLTEAIDDARMEIEWAIRNLHEPPRPTCPAATHQDDSQENGDRGRVAIPEPPQPLENATSASSPQISRAHGHLFD